MRATIHFVKNAGMIVMIAEEAIVRGVIRTSLVLMMKQVSSFTAVRNVSVNVAAERIVNAVAERNVERKGQQRGKRRFRKLVKERVFRNSSYSSDILS
jgi:hypothetical protein